MLISVNTSKLENSENGIKGLATVSFGDAFKVQSISIVEGKNGTFISMPSYKSKQLADDGSPIYKDICNPITKGFRDQLYDAIMSSFNNDRESVIGEADGRTSPKYGIKVTPLDNAGNKVGIARIYLEDSFVIGNVAIMKSKEGKMFASMPSYKTSQVDENGKAVYKDICYPATKEFREQLQKDVVNTYLETVAGIEQPNHATFPPKTSYEQAMENELPFDDGFQDPVETKPERAEVKKTEEKKPEKSKAKKEEKPKSIKERLAAGEAKKKAQIAKNAEKPKVPTKEVQIA